MCSRIDCSHMAILNSAGSLEKLGNSVGDDMMGKIRSSMLGKLHTYSEVRCCDGS